ncbi:MAG: type II toxin-antitoxin system PemK/MazF family toxin [Acidimicrobiales bacterium]|nr:type II toxin-antitoxin system PemK/MazF family toxin [Acidimicrobiales bacterium]
MAVVPVERGDVVWVCLVGALGVEKKGHDPNDPLSERPCLVVQNNGGNAGSPLTIVAPITDAGAYKGYPAQVQVPASELGPGGKDSVVECGHIRSIDRDHRINAARGVVAHLPASRMESVDKALEASLGL